MFWIQNCTHCLISLIPGTTSCTSRVRCAREINWWRFARTPRVGSKVKRSVQVPTARTGWHLHVTVLSHEAGYSAHLININFRLWLSSRGQSGHMRFHERTAVAMYRLRWKLKSISYIDCLELPALLFFCLCAGVHCDPPIVVMQ